MRGSLSVSTAVGAIPLDFEATKTNPMKTKILPSALFVRLKIWNRERTPAKHVMLEASNV